MLSAVMVIWARQLRNALIGILHAEKLVKSDSANRVCRNPEPNIALCVIFKASARLRNDIRGGKYRVDKVSYLEESDMPRLI